MRNKRKEQTEKWWQSFSESLKAVILLAEELAVLFIYCKEDWAVPQKKEKEQYATERKKKVLALLLSKYLKCKDSQDKVKD